MYNLIGRFPGQRLCRASVEQIYSCYAALVRQLHRQVSAYPNSSSSRDYSAASSLCQTVLLLSVLCSRLYYNTKLFEHLKHLTVATIAVKPHY